MQMFYADGCEKGSRRCTRGLWSAQGVNNQRLIAREDEEEFVSHVSVCTRVVRCNGVVGIRSRLAGGHAQGKKDRLTSSHECLEIRGLDKQKRHGRKSK